MININDEKWQVSLGRLVQLEQAEKDLVKARALIDRLRTENAVLKDERKRFIAVVEHCKRHISVAGNSARKYAVALVKVQLEKARLI